MDLDAETGRIARALFKAETPAAEATGAEVLRGRALREARGSSGKAAL